MTPASHVLALLCVLAIAAGQVLFKQTALLLKASGTVWHGGVIGLGLSALAIYGLATLAWIGLLQHAPLSRIYPYMALSFVVVPGAGWLLFRESIGLGYLVGLALIVMGVAVIARQS